jgi:hypothetical protein
VAKNAKRRKLFGNNKKINLINLKVINVAIKKEIPKRK